MVWKRVLILFVLCFNMCHGFVDYITDFPHNMESIKYRQSNILPETNLDVERLRKLQFSEILFGIDNRNNAEFPINVNVSEICLNHLTNVARAVQRREIWALRIVDATAKPPTGILDGNLHWFGSYDECVRSRSMVNKNNKTEFDGEFKGQYCSLNFPLKSIEHWEMLKLFSVIVGVCVPSTCTEKDVFEITGDVLRRQIPDGDDLLSDVECVPETRELSTPSIVVLIVLSIFGLIVLLATLYDVIYKQWLNDGYSLMDIHNEPVQTNGSATEHYPLLNIRNKYKTTSKKESGVLTKVLLAFSISTNSTRLLSTAKKEGSLTAINGIRFLSISWVVLGHTCSFLLSTGANTEVLVKDLCSKWPFQIVLSGELAVDSFFAIGGVLLAFVATQEFEKRKWKINWLMFYFHRFWRIAPTYMFILMIDATIFQYIGNGPSWVSNREEKSCKEGWWKNLLFINNFFKDSCIGWSWYLACDMQFYIITPFLMIPLAMSAMKGVFVLGITLLISMITTGLISAHYNLPPILYDVFMQSETGPYMREYYVKPYCRIGPYLVGILCGYVLHKTKCKVKLKWNIKFCCWLLSTFFALIIIFGRFDPDKKHVMSTGVAALFNATHRTVWATVVCWIIFACATDNAGFINSFLSWSPFIPLGRLSFCVYLIHPLVLIYYRRSLLDSPYYTFLIGCFVFIATTVLTNILAFCVSLVCEAPLLVIEKYLFLPKGREN